MTTQTRRAACAALMTIGVGLGGSLQAQTSEDEATRAWSNNAEFSLVVATGNSRAATVGFRNVYAYRWMGAELSWESGWVRSASRDGKRNAVVTGPGEFEVVVPGTSIDSQRLYSKVRYQRQIAGRHDWFTNLDGVRDQPSNINSQFVFAGGLGTTWRDSERFAFRTSYGVSYTDEDLDVEGRRRFGGYRLFYGVKGTILEGTTVESELTADGSFDTAEDVRTDWLNGVSVAINSNLALKASVRLLFRNVPALEKLNLETPTLGVVVGTVDVPKEQLDTSFSTSLVVTF
jgi:hypothetical protein